MPYNFKLQDLILFLKKNEHKARDIAIKYIEEQKQFEEIEDKLSKILPLDQLERRKLKKEPYNLS